MSVDLTREAAYCPTVSELLSLPVLRGSHVLRGQRSLERPVTGVNLSDTPDYFKWLLPGELMVSTCYAIHNDPKAIAVFVPHLAQRGISALCVKPGPYLGEVPEVMLEQAEKLDFPLIQLPEDVRFSDITSAVSGELLRRQTAMLRSTIRVNEMMTRIIVEGADLDEVAGMVRSLTGCSVLILDCINNRRALKLAEHDMAVFEGLDQDTVCSLVISGSQTYTLEVGSHSFGFLYIYGGGELPEGEESILTQLLQTIPLEIARERTVRENSNRMLTDFLLHLLSDQITDEDQETDRAAKLGLDLKDNHMVVRIRVEERDGENPYTAIFQRTMLTNDIASTARNLGLSMQKILRDEEYLLIFSSPMDTAAFNAISGRFSNIWKKLSRECSALRLTAGCGAPHPGINGLRRSDYESRVALQAAIGNKKGVFLFSQMGLLRIIFADDPDKEIDTFIQDTLGPLLAQNPLKSQELILTLESYFRHFGNLKRVSDELFTHYNTVSYRMRSIQDLTGLDLRDSDERFMMEMALRLYRYKNDS